MKVSRMSQATGFVLAILVFVTPSAHAQLWNIDLPNSTIQIGTSAEADDFITPGFVQDADQALALNPGFVAPAGTFDFGNAVTSVANDGMITSSANAFVTADGELSNTLQVRWSANTLNDSEPPIDGFFGLATANAGTLIAATLTGLNPGAFYTLQVDYHYEGQAVTDHESAFEDPESASGQMNFTIDGVNQPVFSQDLDSDQQPLLPGAVNVTDTLSVIFQAGGTTADLLVDFSATAFAQLAPPNDDDLSGSFFFGEAEFTLVPEPTTIALIVLGGAFAMRRQRG